MFLKLKSDKVTIKGRGFTERRKQLDWISKEYISSPTVSTKGLMLSYMMDVTEGHKIATTDIPGAFLQTDYEEGDVNIKMEEALVTLLKEINP